MVEIYRPEAKCKKCGHDNVSTHYWKEADDASTYQKWARKDSEKPLHEFLNRRCERCKFEWAEFVLNEEVK